MKAKKRETGVGLGGGGRGGGWELTSFVHVKTSHADFSNMLKILLKEKPNRIVIRMRNSWNAVHIMDTALFNLQIGLSVRAVCCINDSQQTCFVDLHGNEQCHESVNQGS